MWSALRHSQRTDAATALSLAELMQSTLRILIASTLGAVLAIYFAAHLTNAQAALWTSTLILFATAASSFAAFMLSARRPGSAAVVWLANCAGCAAAAAHLLGEPGLTLLLAFIPLLATALLSARAGLLAEACVVAAVIWLFSAGPFEAAASLAPVIVAASLAALGIGWALARATGVATEWSVWSLKQAQAEMDDARAQKLDLRQAQEDLVHANQELARLSDRMIAMNQVAEDARRMKEEFVANVSHELRTPLNMIIGFSEMITQAPHTYGTALPPALLADITAIQRNSRHLAKLVDDVLDLSQMEAGRMTVAREWIDPRQLVDEAMLAVRALYESKQLGLAFDCPPDPPALFCDGTRIRQVLLNLLSNAGRFTERGGVRISLAVEPTELVIAVSDTGPGIAIDDQKRLFEPFQQLDSSIRRRHGGSGLGLAISKRFVELHGGRLWLESTPGQGTTFRFSLPIATRPAPEAGGNGQDARRWFSPYYQYQPRSRRSRAPLPDATPRFVVLETGDTLSHLIARQRGDIEIATVRDADSALRELKRSPALALLVNTAEHDGGAGIAARCAELPFAVPTLACWVPGRDEAARRLGVVRYMTKPVERDVLLATVAGLGDGPLSLLLVDDQPEALQLFTRMLLSAERGYRILQAANGQRALALLRERKPDAVLLDLVMPGMDGFGVLREKSQDPAIAGIPVVVITSKDPARDPVASDTLTITRCGGIPAHELLACIQSISDILSLVPAAV